MTETSYLLSLLPLLLSAVLLAVVLIARENQHNRIQQQLLNRILVKEGIEPLPVVNQFQDLVEYGPNHEVNKNLADAIKEIARRKPKQEPVRFNIPNMPAGMGDMGRK